MSTRLEPNEQGTVCCICGRPIQPGVDAIHGLFYGVEARHYECTAAAKLDSAKADFDKAFDRGMKALDELRRRIRN